MSEGSQTRPVESFTAPPNPRWSGVHERRRRGADDTAAACMAMVLDEIDYGVFLLDARQHVRHANRAALTQLRLGRGLRATDNALHPTDARDTAAWNSAIDAAANRGMRRMVSIGQGEDRIAVAIVPLPRADPAGEARVLVLLSRRKLCEELSAYGFARDHGLTGAEGQVLSGLCRGLEPTRIATDTGVAISTVRTQIANIRVKVQVASIRELVQRIAQLPPLLSALHDETALQA